MEYRFDQIAYNSTEKKQPEDSDRAHYIGLEHLDSGCFEVTRWGSDVTPAGEKLVMHKGDILFGKRRAYQRKVGIAPFDGIFSAHGMVLRPKENVVDKDYFPFFIASNQFMERAVRISVGGLSPTINWKDLKEQVFDIPTIEEQQRIADKLWAAYALKESYKRLLAATDEMVKSRFIEMFGDASIERRLGDVSAIVSGKTIDLEKENEGGPIAYLKVADMNLPENERVVSTSSRFVSEATARTSGIVPIGATIFPKNGAAALHNKKRITAVSTCVDMNTMAVYSSTDELLPEFLYAFLVSQDIASLALVGAIPQIRAKDVASLFIPLPSKGKQLEYLALVQQADKSKFNGFKSRFIEMFGDQEKNSRGFEHYSFTDVSDFQGGSQPPKNEWSSSPKDGYIRMLQIRDFTQSEKDNIEYVKISSSTKQCDENDILIGRYGASVGKILTGLTGAYNVAIMKCIPNPSIIDNCYLYYYLNSKYFQDRIIKISSSRGAQAGFNKEDLSTFKIVAPPLPLQVSFKAIAQQADKSKYLS